MKTLNLTGLVLATFLMGSLLAAAGWADEFKVIPSVALKGEYNDNIFFSENNKEDDFIGTLSPGLEIIERTERLDLNLSGAAHIIEYADNDELSGVDFDTMGLFKFGLTPKLDFRANALYDKTTQPDRDIVADGLVQNDRTRRRQRYGAGLDYTFTEKAAISLDYLYQDDDWSGSDRDTQDLTINSGDMLFTYDLSRTFDSTIGRLNAGYANYDYETSEIDYYFSTIGFLHHFSEIYSIQLDAGARYSDAEFDDTNQDDQTWGGKGSLKLLYNGEFTQADLTASRDVSYASGRSGSVLRTAFVFDVRHRFLEKLWAGLSTGYYLNKSDQDEFSSEEIDEQTFRIRPRLLWELHRYVTLEGAYSYTYINDDADNTDSQRNLVYLQIKFEYPVIE